VLIGRAGDAVRSCCERAIGTRDRVPRTRQRRQVRPSNCGAQHGTAAALLLTPAPARPHHSPAHHLHTSRTKLRTSDQHAREQEDARLQALAKLASKQANRVAQARQKQLADQEALLERARELQPFAQLAVDHVQQAAARGAAGGRVPGDRRPVSPPAPPSPARPGADAPAPPPPAPAQQQMASAPRAAAQPSAAAGTR
jgi:hypothetical protein